MESTNTAQLPYSFKSGGYLKQPLITHLELKKKYNLKEDLHCELVIIVIIIRKFAFGKWGKALRSTLSSIRALNERTSHSDGHVPLKREKLYDPRILDLEIAISEWNIVRPREQFRFYPRGERGLQNEEFCEQTLLWWSLRLLNLNNTERIHCHCNGEIQ